MQLPDAQSLVTQARSLLSSRQDLAWLGIRDTRLELILATSGLAFEKTSSARPPPSPFFSANPFVSVCGITSAPTLRLVSNPFSIPFPFPLLPHSSPPRALEVNLSRPLFFWPLTFSIPVLSPPTSRAT